MVGSRKPTANGRETALRFSRYLSERGLTIVSGLATGIDGASHRGGLQGCGSTVAVLGSGPDVLFPRSHERLSAEIIARGLIVSEYPPGIPPLAAHFPQRNRIIAGMSVGTLVVEAARAQWLADHRATRGKLRPRGVCHPWFHPQPHGKGMSPPDPGRREARGRCCGRARGTAAVASTYRRNRRPAERNACRRGRRWQASRATRNCSRRSASTLAESPIWPGEPD